VAVAPGKGAILAGPREATAPRVDGAGCVARAECRPYEELLRERVMESQAFWASYDGDRSLVGILRRRFQRMDKR